jgi:hemoglobin-like flavoprotein
MYTFGEGLEQSEESMFRSAAFQGHAKGVVAMLQMALEMMLGDDMETLAQALAELGGRHVDYGVHPAHYSVVQTALLRTLGGALGGLWTTEVRQAWAAVFKFVSKTMMSGAGSQVQIFKERRRDTEQRKSATLRLSIIGHSPGTSRLVRSGMGTPQRFRGSPQRRDSAPPQMPKRHAEEGPPKLPRRHSDPIVVIL